MTNSSKIIAEFIDLTLSILIYINILR